MNKLTITDKVFVPVNPILEFPKEDDFYLCSIVKTENGSTSYYFKEIKFYSKDNYFQLYKNEVIIYWLKEETNKYVLSREEMEQVITKAVELAREGIVVHRISEWETEKEFDYTDSQIINSIL